MRRYTNRAVQPQKIAKVLESCMSEVQGMYYLCCENLVTDNLTAQLLRTCSEQFWHMQSRFPYDVAQIHHVQIRDSREPHNSPLCLLIDVWTRLLKRNTLRQQELLYKQYVNKFSFYHTFVNRLQIFN